MTDAEFVRIMREHFDGLFPKVCPNCGRRYATLRDYILNTMRIGPTISYDAELGDWNTDRPIGALALANCSCGTTLALSTDGMPLAQITPVLKWIEAETKRRGVTPKELLGWVRDEVRREVLGE